MIARLPSKNRYATPIFDTAELRTESDVEQKLIYPFLTHSSYLSLSSAWVRTKEYMSPTHIDKTAGKKHGYYPDYSIWLGGIPLVIIEAKMADTALELALREARLYALEINKRYPPNINPIGFVFACNGDEMALSPSDSEQEILRFESVAAQPGSAILETLISSIGRSALEAKANRLSAHFQVRSAFSTASFMGGQGRLNEQLGVNEFAEPLFPTLTKYFGATSEETPDEVIDRAYVTSDELGRYEGVLETYLKAKTPQIAGNQLRPIETSKRQASGISTEVQKFSQNPKYYSRVQLIVGAVGSGKSTFIRRYYRKLMSDEVNMRTRWAFIDFNVFPPGENIQNWIAYQFLGSFSEVNQIELHDYDLIEAVFSHELRRFDQGANKRLSEIDPAEFERRRSTYLDGLTQNPVDFARCAARYFSGEKGLGLVVAFDNVDKRSRDLQLSIFEGAQWFKDLTRALVLVNLRDSTFAAHRDEPPLDAFVNAINFYVHPPRFAQVIRKRLELVLEVIPDEVDKKQEYYLSSGYKVQYPASRLGEFLMTIYLSLFDQRSLKVASALEALVAKDVRRALGMFADILVSPHIPTDQITGTVLTDGAYRIQEFRIIRALMRQRNRYYNGSTSYIKNIMDLDQEHARPSNFLYCDILEYMIRNRKARIDFAQEGYATIATIKKKMSMGGYDDDDVSSSVRTLIEWGLLEPESLVVDILTDEDAVRVHATGFIHMRFFIERVEYAVSATADMRFLSRQVAEEIGRIWAGQGKNDDLSRSMKRKVLSTLKSYLSEEYNKRCRRHAFYEEVGLGGKVLLDSLDRALGHLEPQRAGGGIYQR
ncbi:type I restriction enzyme HsdR N-terminal domain-containing protein [Amorphus sp. 3PC139-8]|uniref:type I restriction enzyme HsdR N-terminal domain-containing protein n=1 Tax=Amorphus sp. 3PC139-8 TaxID=2735676 RepID=UPI00345D97A1